MGFLKVIRKWALRDKTPIQEIARRTGVSRNTIKKYLREGIVEPGFRAPDRPGKPEPYIKHLTAWLTTDQRKSRKERRTAKQPRVTFPLAMQRRPVDARRSGVAWI
jgi:hypothetical protein